MMGATLAGGSCSGRGPPDRRSPARAAAACRGSWGQRCTAARNAQSCLNTRLTSSSVYSPSTSALASLGGTLAGAPSFWSTIAASGDGDQCAGSFGSLRLNVSSLPQSPCPAAAAAIGTAGGYHQRQQLPPLCMLHPGSSARL